MDTTIPLNELDVIGYATSLSEQMVPTTVAPVFARRADPDKVLFPPFVISSGYVCNGSLGSIEEFECFAARGQVTGIQPRLPAQPDHELWIDADMMPHYDPIDVANETLGKIATDHIDAAKVALKQGYLDKADHLAGVALCADDRRLEPLAIRAAIRQRQGRTTAVRVMAKLASPSYTRDVFDTVMEHFASMIPAASAISVSKTAGFARMRPEACFKAQAVA